MEVSPTTAFASPPADDFEGDDEVIVKVFSNQVAAPKKETVKISPA